MSSAQYTPGMPAPTGFERFVRPEHVSKFPFIPQERRQNMYNHIVRLWTTGINQPAETQEHMTAAQQLANITTQLSRQNASFRQQQQQQQQQAQAQAQAQAQTQAQVQSTTQPAAPGSSGQQSGQQNQPLPPQQTPTNPQQTQQSQQPQVSQLAQAQKKEAVSSLANQSQGATQGAASAGQQQNLQSRIDWNVFKADIEKYVNNLKAPAELARSNEEEAKKWVELNAQKARQSLTLLERSNSEHANIQKHVAEKMKSGPLTDEEKTKIRNAMSQVNGRRQQAQNYLVAFQKMASKNAQDAGATLSENPSAKTIQEQPRSSQPQVKNEPAELTAKMAPQASAVSKPLQKAQAQRAVASNNYPSGQTPTSATILTPVKTEAPRPLPPQDGVAVAQQPAQQPVQQQPGPQPQAPQALSHQDALDRARNHPQVTGANSQAHTSTQNNQPQHGHPGMPRPEPPHSRSEMNRHSMNKPLNVAPLQPVGMPAARPTLSGGPGAQPGVMSQPGLQKHPGYVLEGEGERVLSEKKLEELVRQVTGSAGGEGAESLDPEVKETLLDLADEFVDNVITSACRVAKLRASSTLELRDLQLILERNYNIRVPGYASDELRTVKKIQPTQAWAQKMSAVQAAKVTGGKSDL